MIAGKVDTKDLPPSLAVTKGVNKFGQMVFKDLEKSTNLVFSPFSLSTALAMLTPGAKGNTFKQVLITSLYLGIPCYSLRVSTES